MTSVPSSLHLVHVEKYLSLTDLEVKTKREHWSSDITKACFPKRTHTKTAIFFTIVFGQMLSGHQVCSALPSLLQIYTILLITIWGDQNELPARRQPDAAENSLKPRHEWWFGLAFVWRVHARRCLTTSAGDLSPLSLLIFCPLKWKSALRLSSRLATESSSVRLKTPLLSFCLWDDLDRLFISKWKTQYCSQSWLQTPRV